VERFGLTVVVEDMAGEVVGNGEAVVVRVGIVVGVAASVG
jgi:hypothetical protein